MKRERREELKFSAVVDGEVRQQSREVEQNEAVLREEGDGAPVVAEIMRAGYVWNQRVVRPAMVKVRG